MARAVCGCGEPERAVAPPPVAPAEPTDNRDDADLAPDLAALLRSGQRVELVVEVELTGTARIPAGSCSVTYDSWNEIYMVQVPAGSSNKSAAMTLTGVVRRCTDLSVYGRPTSQFPPGTAAHRIVRQK